ncbi:MarR family winged helix-turn-helix transcriptional regulator [Cupriavidus sp. CuC1]|uniref:MarR family winged helix-turn-helix transcriptional regulator n=1 Tax=Cupriavidus sp. CuC1 TaxID=3373131 RepID=UPI0037D1BA77
MGKSSLMPEMVGFRLLKLSNLISRPFFAEFARQHALSLNEWRAIVVLAKRPGSAAQDIAAATGLHPMNVSRAVISLRKSGLVEEARDPDNHRRVLLWLTRTGKKKFDEISPRAERDAGMLFDALTPQEQATFSKLIDKLIARAEDMSLGSD